jgi:hypothetical protein
MPRRSLDDEQKAFVRDNADKGGNWLAEALQVDRAVIYQYAHETGFSVKRRIEPKDGSLKKDRFAWPRKYYKYKKYLVMRDGLRCHYCQSIMTYNEAQVDHILAKARGGSDAPHNLVLACPNCNNIKSTLCYSCPEFREAIQK